MDKLLNTVTQGDCLEIMKTLPDNCIDLVLTDPPYGIGIGESVGGGSRIGKAKTHKAFDDSKTPSNEYFKELLRISKHQIIWGGNYFQLPPSPCWLIWYKRNALPTRTFADCELAWSSFSSPARVFNFRWDGMIQEDMKNKEVRQHPTQKPVELMVWCLENYLMKKWDKDRRPIVFDGFAGSGTTGVACKKCGCDYILVEKEKDYCEIIEKRLAQETLF